MQIKQTSNNKFIDENNIKNTCFLIRHGECISNKKWPIKNYTDEMDKLTKLGEKQILEKVNFFKKYKKNNFKIISSTLTRAIQSAKILNQKLIKSKILSPDERIVEKNHEEKILSFKKRTNSFFKNRIKRNKGPYIIVAHGHLIETLLLLSIDKKYSLVTRKDKTRGIKGIWGVHNGSVSAMVENQFVFFNC